MGESTIKALLRNHDNAVPQKIGFLLLNQFSMLAFASAIEPLRAANRQANKHLFDWVVASPDGNASTASNGICVQTDIDPEALQSCRMVFVCSGVKVRENTTKSILNLIRRLDRNGAVIGAICTGTYVMAAAGLLEGRRCTIHWENIDGLSEEFPHLEITNDLFEIDGNRVTCSGGTASLDMMLNLITQTHGSALAAEVSDQFIHDQSGNQPIVSVWSFAPALGLVTRNYWPWSKPWKTISKSRWRKLISPARPIFRRASLNGCSANILIRHQRAII